VSDPVFIRIPILHWMRLIFDLRRRGGGKGESGAFLLGRRHGGSARVERYLCYDDLDPNAYGSGAIAFHAAGYAALWQYCREKKLEVLADVHTHPCGDVRQSSIDQRNPMLPVMGHTAMIVPNFARTRWWSLNAVGVYEYVGEFQWRSHGTGDTPRRIRLTLW
jgi:proteasome lid subunit RPN8/RPN11